MTKIMKGGIAYNATSNMVALTQAEYNALSTAQKNNGNFYFIMDADPSYFSAENIDYDNTTSLLNATNIQDAVDEVNSLSKPVYYNYEGRLGYSPDFTFEAYGYASIQMFRGMATILMTCKIDANTGSSSQMNFGIYAPYFTTLVGKTITPISGGQATYYNSSGTLWLDRINYGGFWAGGSAYPNLWRPARIYQPSGTAGAWAASACNVGSVWQGTLYGTYTE